MKRGDKVICIKDNWVYKEPGCPIKGQIYTVTELHSDGYVELEECCGQWRFASHAFQLIDGPPSGSYGPVREEAPTHLVQA